MPVMLPSPYFLEVDRAKSSSALAQLRCANLARFFGSAFSVGWRPGAASTGIAAAAVVMMCSLLYLVAVFKGAGHLFEQFFSVPYDMAIGLALIVVMLYTSIGGFVSVVRTDALQGVLMMIGAMMIFYFVTGAAGGVTALGSLAQAPQTAFVFELNGGIPSLSCWASAYRVL